MKTEYQQPRIACIRIETLNMLAVSGPSANSQSDPVIGRTVAREVSDASFFEDE